MYVCMYIYCAVSVRLFSNTQTLTKSDMGYCRTVVTHGQYVHVMHTIILPYILREAFCTSSAAQRNKHENRTPTTNQNQQKKTTNMRVSHSQNRRHHQAQAHCHIRRTCCWWSPQLADADAERLRGITYRMVCTSICLCGIGIVYARRVVCR